MRIRFVLGVVSLSLLVSSSRPVAADNNVFTTAFTPAEFSARRVKVMDAIGDAVAIISGATETSTYTKFRQGSQFFYLCGVEVPRAILLIDGRTKSSTLFLGAGGPSNEGPQLTAATPDAAKITGIEQVLDRARFTDTLGAIAAGSRAIYMPDRDETLGAGATDRVQAHARDRAGSVGSAQDESTCVQRQSPGRGADVVDQEPRSDRRYPAGHQEPGGGRRHS